MVLAQEVVLRLARWARETVASKQITPVVKPNVDALCAALIGPDPRMAKGMIVAAHAKGASHEELCLFHIGEAARRLGDLWEDDDISFQDMALAAGRMLHLLRDLRDLAPPFEQYGSRSALFATVPGERHVLGVTMAADIFRDNGWEVDLRLGQTEEELSKAVQLGGYPIVGLSAASADRVRALARAVIALRIAAPQILIFVGGYVARLDPDIAVRVGADGSAWDMDDCKRHLETLHSQFLHLPKTH